MSNFGQIAQHRHRVGAISILPRKFGQSLRGMTFHDHVKQIQHAATVGQPQHRAHLIGGGFARAVRNRLIQQRSCIPRRPFRCAGDQGQSAIGNLRAFGIGNLAQQRHLHFGFDPFQVKPLAA